MNHPFIMPDASMDELAQHWNVDKNQLRSLSKRHKIEPRRIQSNVYLYGIDEQVTFLTYVHELTLRNDVLKNLLEHNLKEARKEVVARGFLEMLDLLADEGRKGHTTDIDLKKILEENLEALPSRLPVAYLLLIGCASLAGFLKGLSEEDTVTIDVILEAIVHLGKQTEKLQEQRKEVYKDVK